MRKKKIIYGFGPSVVVQVVASCNFPLIWESKIYYQKRNGKRLKVKKKKKKSDPMIEIKHDHFNFQSQDLQLHRVITCTGS